MIFVWETSCFYRNCTKFSEHERSTLIFKGLPQKAPKIMLYAGGTGYGDIDFKAYSMILGGFRGNPLKIRVLRSCSENLVQFR